MALTALVVRDAFDRLVTKALTPPAVITTGVLLVTAAGARGWLRAQERATAERLGQDYVTEVRLALFDRALAMPPRALDARNHGGVLLRFIGDLESLRRWVSLGLSRLVVAGTATAGTVAALAVVSPSLALTVTLVMVAGTAGSAVFGRRLQEAATEARRRRSRIAGRVSEVLAVPGVVAAFDRSDRERRWLRRHSERLGCALVEQARAIGRLRGLTEATGSLALAAALLVGSLEVTAGSSSPGTVVAAISIVGLLVPPMRDLGRTQEYWHASRVSVRKLREFLAQPLLPREPAGAPPLTATDGRIELRAVGLEGALWGVSASAPARAVVAVVGPNGAGKSSLLSILGRLVAPDEGQVLVDGQDICACELASVRRAIGVAGPDLPLVRGSVRNNLSYRWPEAPPEELARVVQICELGDLVADLSDGEETRIAEGGRGLSAGQRTRLALARALVGDPPILLLDEADTNLDARASAVVKRVIAGHVGTAVVVTHRIEQVVAADVVWHLDRGRLIEAGPPRAVLDADGPTARLFGWEAGGRTVSTRSDTKRTLRRSPGLKEVLRFGSRRRGPHSRLRLSQNDSATALSQHTAAVRPADGRIWRSWQKST